MARALVLGALIGVASVLASAGPASAHTDLVGSEPSAGSVVSLTPQNVRLVFTKPVTAGDASVQVRDPGDRRVDTGRPAATGAAVLVPLAPDAGAGLLTVTWNVVGADGHLTSGRFTFTVDPTGTASQGGQALAVPSGDVSVAGGAASVAGGAASVAGGAAAFRAVPWTQAPARALQVAGPAALAVGLAACLAWSTAGGRPGRRRRVAGRVVVGVTVLGSGLWMSRSTHAAGLAHPAAGLGLVVIHISAMIAWVGGAVLMAVMTICRRRGAPAGTERPDVVMPETRWSPWATFALPVGLGAGVLLAVNEVGSLRLLLVPSAFVVLLAFKTGLALLALGLAYAHHTRSRRGAEARPASVLLVLQSLTLIAALAGSTLLTQTDPHAGYAAKTSVVVIGPRVAVASCPQNRPGHLDCTVKLYDRGVVDRSVSQLSVQLSQGTTVTRRLDLNRSSDGFAVAVDDPRLVGRWVVHLGYRVMDSDQGNATYETDLTGRPAFPPP